MERIGVVGAGTMGSGIAQKTALEGRPVVLVDVSEQALDRGRSLMERIFNESLERKLLTAEKVAQLWQALTFTTDLGALHDAGLVVEAVFEDREVKRKLYPELERVVASGCVLASNTSSYQISELGQALSDPSRLVGLHFFYHPVKNRLLEVIPGAQSTPEAVATARRYCSLLGKVEIVCSDSPGFVVNRFFVPWLNEAVRLLAEGAASLEVIEATAKQGFRLGMGPFELMNVTGVPVAMHAADGLAGPLGEFYKPDNMLTQQAGLGPWNIGTVEGYDEQVFNRLLGVAWAVASSIVAEGTATPLDVDLGAQVGLRWPLGPFGMYNKMNEAQRAAALDSFRARYADYPLAASLTGGAAFSLPAVTEEQAGGLALIELARPDRSNALDGKVFADLRGALERQKDAKTVVLRGKGKNFAAGADVKFFIKSMEAGDIPRIVDFTRDAQDVVQLVEDHAGKLVAAIDGFALGGGAELMLAADVIAVTARATIGFPETGIGIYPGLGGTFRLARRVGLGLAKYLIGTGQMLSGTDAVAIGVADHCLAPDELEPAKLALLGSASKPELPAKWAALAAFMEQHTLEELLGGEFTEEWQQKLAAKLKQKAPLALRLAWRLIEGNHGLPSKDASANELTHLPEVFGTEDALEGLKSIGKFRPQFKGR